MNTISNTINTIQPVVALIPLYKVENLWDTNKFTLERFNLY